MALEPTRRKRSKPAGPPRVDTNPTPPGLAVDLKMAEQFLTLLDEGATEFTFQTFDDNANRKAPNGGDKYARVLHGTFEDCAGELTQLNNAGAGVYVTVNRTDGKGRKRENITGVRAVWQEDDGDCWPLPDPHITVETSPGHHHRYVFVDGMPLDEHQGVMARIIKDHGSDPNAKDLSRVLRLPGFFHQKKDSAKGLIGTPFQVYIVDVSGAQPWTWDRIKATYPPIVKAAGANGNGQAGAWSGQTWTAAEVTSALKMLDPDMEYTDWLNIGMGIHDASHGSEEGLEAWRNWSEAGDKYQAGICETKWASFTPKGVTLKTLFGLAGAAGWTGWIDPENPGNPAQEAPPVAEAPPNIPSIDSLVITEDELMRARLAPRCIVHNYLYSDLAVLAAPGGVGKTTIMLYEMAHIVLGRRLWGLDVETPGKCMLITAEDSRETCIARLNKLIACMSLTNAERTTVRESILIWDVSGLGLKLVRTEKDIVLTALADQIVKAFKGQRIAMVVFDPLASFGANEESVNSNAQALVTAARRIRRGLDCCVRYIHHTGQEAARNANTDQYAARGGSALTDGARMTTILQRWEEDGNLSKPENVTPPMGAEALVVLARPKLSYAPPQPNIWIKRDGYLFHYETETKEPPEVVNKRLTIQIIAKLRYEIEHGRKHTQTSFERDGHVDDINGLTFRKFRRLVMEAIDNGLLQMADLPEDERKGSRTEYIKINSDRPG